MTTAAPVSNRPYADRLLPTAPPRALAYAVILAVTAVAGASVKISSLAPIAIAVVACAVAAAWHRPLVASVVVVGLVPAMSGLGRGVGVPYLKLSEALLLLCTAVVLLRRPKVTQRFGRADWGLLAFAVAGAGFGAAHVLSGTSEQDTFVRVGLQPTMLFITWWTASRATRDEQDLRIVLRWLLLVSIVPSVLTILQAADAPGIRAMLITATDGSLNLAKAGVPGVIRATGPFPIWHSLAAYLVTPLAVGVALLLRSEREVLKAPVLIGILALDAAALVLSLTITVIGWAVVAVLVVALLQRRLTQAIALLALAGAASAIVFAAPLTSRLDAQIGNSRASSSEEVPQTIAYRVGVWRRDFLPLLDRAVPHGIGNELPPSVIFQNTENQYISLVLRGGVVFLLAGLTAMVLAATQVAAVVRRRRGLLRVMAGAALGIVLFLPFATMIWPYLTNAGFPQSWLSLGGAVVGAAAAGGSLRR